MGLCFWALALAWDWQRWRVLAALLVLVLAYLAHALPVVWTLGLFTYTWLARRMEPFRRGLLAGGFVLVLVIFHSIVGARSLTSWSPLQLTLSPGEDQAWAFDTKYYVVLMGLVIIWGLLFMQLVRRLGAREVVSSIPFQLCVIGAAAVFILPGTVLIPGFYHALSYIAERMSLGVAVCLCALLGAGRPRLLERCALLVVAFTFFGFIYHDERTLNSFEDRMQDVVSRVQPEKRFDSPYIPAPHGGMLRIEDRRVVIYQVGGNTSGRVII